MSNTFLAACLLAFPVSAVAQAPAMAAETQAVQATINAFFDGMRRADSTAVRRTLAPGAVFHVINSRDGQTRLLPENPSTFVKAVGTVRSHGDYAWSRVGQVEYSGPCAPGAAGDCLPTPNLVITSATRTR